jgi:hypothetical protein
MARQEQDREDLLAEATALVERARFAAPPYEAPVVAGFRRDGGLSIFLGANLVYQFNSAGQLRRALSGGLLYKADRGGLSSLRRVRTEQRTDLVCHDLSPAEVASFLDRLREHLAALRRALAAGECDLDGQVPGDRDVLGRLRHWLGQHAGPIKIACAPNLR